MRIDTTIEVGAPADDVFAALLDVERVARALPGADVTAAEADVYTGTIGLHVGPIRVRYDGRVELASVEREARRLVIRASGEARGSGRAEGVITATVRGDGGRAVVDMSTELDVRGRVAQLGQSALAGVAQRMLAEFARNLERELGGAAPATATRARAPGRRREAVLAAAALAGAVVAVVVAESVVRRAA